MNSRRTAATTGRPTGTSARTPLRGKPPARGAPTMLRLRVLALALVLAASAWGPLPAKELPPPAREPHRRALTGDDARRVAALEKQVAALQTAARYGEAVAPAEEAAAL